MGTGCQGNGYWLATNHLSGRGFVQPLKELSSAAWQLFSCKYVTVKLS